METVREVAADPGLALCAASPRAMSNPVVVVTALAVVAPTGFGVRDVACGRAPFDFAIFPGMNRFEVFAGARLGTLGLAIGGAGAMVLC